MFFCPSAEEQDSPVRRKLIGCAKNQTGIPEKRWRAPDFRKPRGSSTLWIVRSASVGQGVFHLIWHSRVFGACCPVTTDCIVAQQQQTAVEPSETDTVYQVLGLGIRYFLEPKHICINKNRSRVTKKFKNNVFPISPLIFCFVKKQTNKSAHPSWMPMSELLCGKPQNPNVLEPASHVFCKQGVISCPSNGQAMDAFTFGVLETLTT